MTVGPTRRRRLLWLVVAGTLAASCSASQGAAQDGPRDARADTSTAATDQTTSPATAVRIPTVVEPSTASPPTTSPPTTSPPATDPPVTPTTRSRPSSTTTTVAPLSHANWATFDWILSDRLIGGGSTAAAVAVAVDGKFVHRAAFGERVPGEPVTRNDRFRIASISKTFTTAAALRLVSAGDVGLDQPVLPSVAARLGVTITDPRLQLVTLRQLLGHASGIGEHEFEMLYGGATSCEQAAAITLAEGAIDQPGTNFRYSNMNFCLAGLVLEALTGLPYQRVIRREVLAPLGIGAMRTAGTRDVRDGDVLHPAAPDRTYMETLGAAGTWIATPSDVVALADSLDPTRPGEHPVSRKLLADMKRPSTPPKPGEAPRQAWYGMGLMLWADGSYGHTGTLENTHAMYLARPDGVTWAVLVSGETPAASATLRSYVDEAMTRSLAP